MAVKLTEGAISAICSGEWDVKPVVQVLDIQPVENKERYEVVISDGSFHQQGLLATWFNGLATSQQLQKAFVVQLNHFVTNTVRDRTIIIILGVDVVLSSCDIIGDSKPFSSTPGSEPSTLRSVAPMQSINQPTTMGGPQDLTRSFPQPNLGVKSPIYLPRQEHNAGPHSSAMAHAPTMLSRSPANSYTTKNKAQPKIIPIAALNPYLGRWTIKARVTAEAELIHYNNAKGDCKVYSFDLLDSDGGEIRATCFNAVADKFYKQIEVGKVYIISNGNIKPAQKAFNHLNNDHEITLDHTSTIHRYVDGTVYRNLSCATLQECTWGWAA